MALNDLIIEFNERKNKVGGIKEIKLWEVLNSGHADADTCSGTVGPSTITDFDLPSDPNNVGVFKFAQGTGKMDISMTQEKGLALCTISIEGFIPNLTRNQIGGLKQLVGKCLMAQVITNAKYGSVMSIQNNLLVGWDNILGSQTQTSGTTFYLHTDFGLFLESVEGSTGAEMGDGTGATVKLTAVQGELPYNTEA